MFSVLRCILWVLRSSLRVLPSSFSVFIAGVSGWRDRKRAVARFVRRRRLSFVEETGRTSDHVVFRHLMLEVRRSVQSLSSAAGLTRIVRLPMELLRGEH
jgi:hypothetical protein